MKMTETFTEDRGQILKPFGLQEDRTFLEEDRGQNSEFASSEEIAINYHIVPPRVAIYHKDVKFYNCTAGK